MPHPRKARRRRKRRPRLVPRRLLLVVLAGAVLALIYLASPARDQHDQQITTAWRDLVAQLQTWTASLEMPAGPTPATPDPGASDSVQIYFAPVKPLNPWGIDDALVAFIQGAHTRVVAAFYDLSLDAVADALIDRHQAGVQVALVSDSHYEDRAAVRRCMAAGIPVVFDERSAFMHNKFCVVDDAAVWTGSTNVTENGMFRNNNNALLIRSPQLAENYAAEFGEMFYERRFGKRSPRATPHPVLTVAGIGIECYFAPEDEVAREILEEIEDAVRSIDFMAFSFTSDPIGKAMIARMARGVRVRGLFEGRNVNDRYAEDDRLRDAGAAIYLDDNPYSLHHKVIVIDGGTTITGSYNFSKSAETANDENVLILHDPGIARQYTEAFEALLP